MDVPHLGFVSGQLIAISPQAFLGAEVSHTLSNVLIGDDSPPCTIQDLRYLRIQGLEICKDLFVYRIPLDHQALHDSHSFIALAHLFHFLEEALAFHDDLFQLVESFGGISELCP